MLHKLEDLTPKKIVLFGVGVLTLFYFLIVLVDLFNIFNLRSVFSDFTFPFLWDYLFVERGPVEILQWLSLGFFAITSGFVAGKLSDRGRVKESIFWSLMALTGVIMVMEDAGNMRHFFLRESFPINFVLTNQLETLYFITIAAIPLSAIFIYGKHVKHSKKTLKLLVLAVVFYGFAGFISGPADLTSINYHIGNAIYETHVFIGGEELRELYEQTDEEILELEEEQGIRWEDVRYRMKDTIVEESSEYLGATMFFAAAVSYLNLLKKEES